MVRYWHVRKHTGRDSEPWEDYPFASEFQAKEFFNHLCDTRKQGACQLVAPNGEVVDFFSIPSVTELTTAPKHLVSHSGDSNV